MRKLLAASIVLAVAACDAPPTGVQGNLDETVPPPNFAAADASPVFLPFAFTVNNCAELVDVSGQFHLTVRDFVNANGKRQFKFRVNAKGRGVGQTTGAVYEWQEQFLDIYNFSPGDGTLRTNTWYQHARLIGHGQAVNAHFHLEFKVTFNANGDVTAFHFRVRDTCG
jgi:hypothetical protein